MHQKKICTLIKPMPTINMSQKCSPDVRVEREKVGQIVAGFPFREKIEIYDISRNKKPNLTDLSTKRANYYFTFYPAEFGGDYLNEEFGKRGWEILDPFTVCRRDLIPKELMKSRVFTSAFMEALKDYLKNYEKTMHEDGASDSDFMALVDEKISEVKNTFEGIVRNSSTSLTKIVNHLKSLGFKEE